MYVCMYECMFVFIPNNKETLFSILVHTGHKDIHMFRDAYLLEFPFNLLCTATSNIE